MDRDLDPYLRKPYSRILIPNDDGRYTAEMLDFPGCVAEGETADEAIREVEGAAKAWIETALEEGQSIPEPEMNVGYSGHFALRLPRGLHRKAARLAQREDTSLNQFIASALAARVGAEDLVTRLAERLRPVSEGLDHSGNVVETANHSRPARAASD